MHVVMDVLQSVFWSLAYISIIVCGFRYRKEKLAFMPHIAGALNFAWEFHAFLGSGGYWVHTLWLLLDTLILAYNLYILENVRRRVLYSLAVLSFTAVMPAVIALPNGMLVSSFIIDIEMAAVYLLVLWKDRPKTSQRHDYIYIYIFIAVFRLLGDLFAWLAYMRYSTAVLMIGAAVLCVNIFYLCSCFEFLARGPRPDGKRRSCKQRLR